jgi:hypothetical protein
MIHKIAAVHATFPLLVALGGNLAAGLVGLLMRIWRP